MKEITIYAVTSYIDPDQPFAKAERNLLSSKAFLGATSLIIISVPNIESEAAVALRKAESDETLVISHRDRDLTSFGT